MRLQQVMQRQDNYLQEHYNQSRAGGVPASVHEERYSQKPGGIPVSVHEERYSQKPGGIPVSVHEERYCQKPGGIPVSVHEERYSQKPGGIPVSVHEERYCQKPGGIPVSVHEERYIQKPDQYASEPSSTTSVQPRNQSHPYTSHQPIKMEDSAEQTADSLSGNMYTENRNRYPNEAQEMRSYSHQETVTQSRQPQPLGMYKNQAPRPSPQMVQPQQSVISSTQSTQSNMQTTNLFYENTVSKDSEIQLSMKDRQTLMNERNSANTLDIVSVEEVVSTQEVGSDLNLSQADASDLSERPVSSDKTHVCMTCFKTFKNKPQLTQHELVHNGIRKHICSYCDKSFKQLCHLNQHIRTHTGDRPYKCTIEGCGRSFAQLSNLHHHQKNHEEHIKRDVSRAFRCVICDRSYANESSLRTHTLKLHVHLKQVDTGPLVDTPATKKRKKKNAAEPPILSAVDLSSDDDGSPTQNKAGLNLSIPLNQSSSSDQSAGWLNHPVISSLVSSLNQSTGGLSQPVITSTVSSLNQSTGSFSQPAISSSVSSLNQSTGSLSQSKNQTLSSMIPSEAINRIMSPHEALNRIMSQNDAINKIMSQSDAINKIMGQSNAINKISPSDAINKILLKRLMGGENPTDILSRERSTTSQPLQSPPFQAPDSISRQVPNIISPFQPLPKVSTLAHRVPVSLQQQDRAVFSHETFNPDRASQSRTLQQKGESQGTYM